MSGFCDFYGGALPFSEFYDKLRAKITRPSTLSRDNTQAHLDS